MGAVPPPPLEDLLNHAIPVGEAMAALQALTSAILIPSAFMLVRRLSAIRDHLAKINGTIAAINQWRADHDHRIEAEDRQHEMTRQQCQTLHMERLQSVNERINELWVRIGDRRQGRRPTD